MYGTEMTHLFPRSRLLPVGRLFCPSNFGGAFPFICQGNYQLVFSPAKQNFLEMSEHLDVIYIYIYLYI